MSYNVHGLSGDLAALTDVVRAAAPDVLIAQEAPRRMRWRGRCADLARRLGMIHAGGGLPSLGNAVFTTLRVDAREEWCLRYPLTPGRHLRGAVFVRCAVGRSPFVVVGSHLATDPGERPVQATILKKMLADLQAPVVLGIDVNENSGGAAWRTVADGLLDAGASDSDVATFPAGGRRIDAVFVDPRWTVGSYEVLDTPRARAASDHLPLLVEVALP
jgi:endonuclease/exonuclease/phosphatase family metal-dependent hydrolase